MENQGTALQRAQLHTFTRWLLVVAFSYALVNALVAVFFHDLALGFAALIDFCYGCLVLTVKPLIRRSNVQIPVLVIIGGMLVLAVLVALVISPVFPGLALIPLLAIIVALPYVQHRMLLRLAGVCFLVIISIMLIGEYVPSLSHIPLWLIRVYRVSVFPAVALLIFVLLIQFSTRLSETLTQTQQANKALQHAQHNLEGQVAERTAALQGALDENAQRAAVQSQLLSENATHLTTIRHLSVPVLPLGKRMLVMPLIGTFDHERFQVVQQRALTAIEQSSARYLVLDVTGMPTIDLQVAHGLIALTQAVRLLGVEPVLAGIRPEVAQSIVALDVDIQQIATTLDIQTAIENLSRNTTSRASKTVFQRAR